MVGLFHHNALHQTAHCTKLDDEVCSLHGHATILQRMSAVLTRQGFGLLASVALLAACASVRPAVITPRLGVTDLEVIDFGVFEQRYRVQLRVQNPNPNALHIRGLDYTLHINEQEFSR